MNNMRPLQFPVPDRPLVSAHRGAGNIAPENTLAAFEAALVHGADMIELDVHPTRDGRLAVIHDVTTARTTGRDRRVQDMTVDEVRSLDAGSWFGPDHAGQKIPLLEEVLDWARGRVYLNLDVRNYPGLDFYSTGRTAEVLIKAAARTKTMDQVIVQCLDHRLAADLRRQCPQMLVGITLHGRPAREVEVARAAGAVLISGDAAFSTPELVAELHAAGIGWMTTAELRLPGQPEDPATLAGSTRRLRDLGADIIVTDDLDATFAALEGTP